MLSTILLVLSGTLALPAVLFLLYPPGLLVLSRLAPYRGTRGRTRMPESDDGAPQSGGAGLTFALVLVASRRDEKLDRKLAELVRLAERESITELFVGLDGGAPPTTRDGTVQWIGVVPQRGKNAVLEEIRRAARADVLVLTDVDARLEPESLDALFEHFADANVGGVTGRRQIVDDTRFGAGQAGYCDFDDRIRRLEMRCFGSVTSCEGKLYAVRRSCLDGGLPDDVSDDLHCGLCAVAGGSRLVSEPAAVARIGRPARDIRHELERRRRVTCRGVATLWHRRDILDPRRHGRYAVALLVNKLLRRLACPAALLAAIAFVAGALALPDDVSAAPSGPLVLAALAIASILLLVVSLTRGHGTSLVYLGLGTLGTTLGVLDYLRGEHVTIWEPKKTDSDANADAATRADIDRPPLAYLVSHYPKLTETFVIDEVLALDRSFRVTVHPIVPGDVTEYDPAAILEDRIVRDHFLSFAILRDAALEFARSPKSLFWPVGTLLRRAARKPRVALKSLLLVPKIMALAYRLRRRPVRHLHAGFANHPATVAWMVARLRQLPFSFVAHANDIFKYHYLLDEKVRDAAAVIAISRYNKDYLLEACPEASAERIHVLPTGVDCERLAFRLRPKPGPVFRLLSVGSLLEKKGHSVLIDAIASLRAAGHDVRCRIVGEGTQRRALERRIERLALGGAVELSGARNRERVREFLDEADAFVLACVEPSDRGADGIPVALMEAMACGLPVVSSRLKAIPELVGDGRSGLLCEPGDAECIARSVLRLIEDDGLREALARGGREWVERRFDQRGIALARTSIIADAIDSHAARHPSPVVQEAAGGGR